MNAVVIRLAGEGDLDALTKIYIEFHEFHVRGVPGRPRAPEKYDYSEMQESLKQILHDDKAAIFLAEVSNEVAGLAEVYMRQDELEPAIIPRRYGHLQSLMVLESFREQGLGSKLLEVAEQWVKERGATEMQLDTWEFAEGPLHFYKARNYRTLKRKLVKNI